MNHPISSYLIWSGVLPFAIGTLLVCFPSLTPHSFVHPESAVSYLTLYAIAITLFMAGTHWGVALGSQKTNTIYWPLIISNIQLITTCIAYTCFNWRIQIGVVCVSLCASILVDYFYYQKNILTKNYIQLRFKVTITVLCFLTLVLIQ